MSRRQWDDDDGFFLDESQGPVGRASIVDSIFAGVLIGMALVVVIVQVLR